MPLRLRNRPTAFVLTVLGVALLVYLVLLPILPRGAIAYVTRPMWDHDERPKEVLRHYWADGLETAELCRLHGWEARSDGPELWDATIFSTELDLLLIRLHELSPLVDRFFIVESDRTFTGLEKPLVLKTALANDARFNPFLPRITYRTLAGRSLEKGESPWDQEIALRQSMTSLLWEHIPSEPAPPPVMIFSDVDELVSRKTAQLLKACQFGPPLHLGLRTFLYSFEFEEGGETDSWRPSAVEWPLRGNGDDEFYRHGKVTERVLPNSGWHCSWCFRRLSDFVTKATGYSHVDRLGSRPAALLRPARIQDTICRGLDMFAMLPEAYTYRDFLNKMRLVPSKSAVDVPSYVVEHADELRYLLPGPGNCVREDAPET